MHHRLRNTLPTLLLLLVMLGCNVPVEQLPPPPDLQTAAALTVQALLATPSVTASETPSATLATATVTATAGATTTITPTFSTPALTVRESTNCRTGPGDQYEIVFTYLSGKKLPILGRSDRGDFWLVKSTESPTGSCWLWGQYVDVTGSYWVVPSVTAPPTTTSAPPRAPTIVEWRFNCSGGTMTFLITWKDQSSGETGYRVFRNGQQVAELPANSTTYTDTYVYGTDENVDYYVQVYSPTGSANSSVMRVKTVSGECQ